MAQTPYSDWSPDALITQGRKFTLVGAASATEFAPTRAVHCNISGTYTCVGIDDSAAVDLVMVSGMIYQYHIKAMTAGATGGLVLVR